MPESLYPLFLLACPVGMGLMMWFMMRGGNKQTAEPQNAAKQAELTRLQAEIDQLRAERDYGRTGAPREPST